jgi:GNAT superfamily N-acetyltransferase
VQRYLGVVDLTAEARLRELTATDGRNSFAWVALQLPQGAVMGLAQFIRTAAEPTVAEAALLVIDQFQGLGLGSALFDVLCTQAWRQGVSRLVGTLLTSNVAATRLLVNAGAYVTLDCPGVFAATVDLTDGRT